MCTLHLFFRVFPEAPVLLAANRDELLDRRWEGPGWLSRVPRIFGPRDLVSGGTWLGVNEAGLTAAITNHEGTLASGESLCSRGLVVLETLRHGSAREAARFVSAFAPPCKSYTLLLADPEHAYVADQAGGRCTVFALEPGFHVVTNKRFDDPRDPKARRSRKRMEALASVDRLPTPGEFFAFLADHSRAGSRATPLCIHPDPNPAGAGPPVRHLLGERGGGRARRADHFLLLRAGAALLHPPRGRDARFPAGAVSECGPRCRSGLTRRPSRW